MSAATPRRRPGRPPAEESRDRIDVIVRVARRRFAQHGFDGTALSAVAADAEISLSALYHYVKTKQELYELVFDETLQRLWDDIVATYRAMPPDDTFAGRAGTFAAAIHASGDPDSKKFLATTPIEVQRYPELAVLLTRRDATRDRALHAVFEPLLQRDGHPSPAAESTFMALKVLFSGWANESHLYPAQRDTITDAMRHFASLLDRYADEGAANTPQSRRARRAG